MTIGVTGPRHRRRRLEAASWPASWRRSAGRLAIVADDRRRMRWSVFGSDKDKPARRRPIVMLDEVLDAATIVRLAELERDPVLDTVDELNLEPVHALEVPVELEHLGPMHVAGTLPAICSACAEWRRRQFSPAYLERYTELGRPLTESELRLLDGNR